MKHDDFQAFKRAWSDYPSQDNEGFQPDRGGFKCGWFSALKYERENKPRFSELEDELLNKLNELITATGGFNLSQAIKIARSWSKKRKRHGKS